MAARRALRRLADKLHSELAAPGIQQHELPGGSDWKFSGFRRAQHCYAWQDRRDDDDENLPRSCYTPHLANRNLGMFKIMSRRTGSLLHQKHGISGVRFCSSEAAMSSQAAMSSPAGFVDAPQNVVLTADIASAAATYANEIQAATSVSFPWTGVLQHFINFIHINTGVPWWGSIALATIAVRTLVFPLTVYQVKLTARFSLLRPELEKIKAEIAKANYDQAVVEHNKKKMNELFERNKTNPFTPLIGALVQAPVFMCFFFGIRTMASTMESFKQGGALWFTDLSAADPYYLLPILTGLSFLVVVELGAADGMQGQPTMKTMKNIMRVCGVALIPLTMSFPAALFSYWLTSNFWTMAQGAVLRNPRVKAYLDIPETAHLDPAKAKATLQQATVSFTPPPKKPVVTLNAPARKSRSVAQ